MVDMTPENFVYWLQGYLEISKPNKIGPTELTEIKNHLKIATSPFLMAQNKTVSKEPQYCSNESNIPYDPQLDCSDAPFVFESESSIPYFDKNRNEKEKTQVYITITNKPLWDSRGEYSHYVDLSDEGKLTTDLISKMGFYDKNKQYYLVIDNELNPPKTTRYNRVSCHSSNHLIAAGKYMGVLNVGTFDNSDALVC
jgi:hypothetical protein